MSISGLKRWFAKLNAGEADVLPAKKIAKEKLHSIAWDDQADVVVVGFGGAGASAAIEARDNGSDVLVLDRFIGGGATKISGGIFYAGGGTAIQKEAGVEDDAENMYQYLKQEVKDAVEEETLRRFCDESVQNFDWMVEQGVPFQASSCPYKTSYPSDRYYFYYSGNESFKPYTNTARAAARGHRAHAKGISGEAIYTPLRETAVRKGVRVTQQCKALRLIVDDGGRVIGVELSRMPPGHWAKRLHEMLFRCSLLLRYATMFTNLPLPLVRTPIEYLEKRYGRTFLVKANKGVVLSAGGFFFNRSMLQQYAPNYLPGAGIGTIADNGSGIQLGESVGGATALMESVSAWRFMNPPQSFIKGVMVTPSGERLCNEMMYGAQVGEQMMKKGDGKGYLIIDHTLWKEAHTLLNSEKAQWFHGVIAYMYLYLERKKASSLEELAKKLNIPVSAFLETVHQYNQLAYSSDEDEMGKLRDFIRPVHQAPYYALNCSFDARIVRCPSLTMGGLKVDEKTGEVLRKDGRTIDGLYAAGRSSVGVASRSYVSGLSIADCIFSGRRAGRHAARLTQGQDKIAAEKINDNAA